MENTDTSLPQPLDLLMTKLGLTNANLVDASTEQLSFKMVQKGRKGKRLTPNIQEKILNALMKLKPDLKIRRRELFHYPMDESIVEKIHELLGLIEKKQIRYPELVDRLVEAGVNHYAVEVTANKTTFYGSGGEVYFMPCPPVSDASAGSYDAGKILAAIEAKRKNEIDYTSFLKKLHEAGVLMYEINLRQRKSVYRGQTDSFRRDIPLAGAEPEPEVKPEKPVKVKKEKKTHGVQAKKKIIPKKKKRPGVIRVTTKARVAARKRFFKKKKKGRSR